MALAPNIVIGPTEFFVVQKFDEHVMSYRWQAVLAEADKASERVKAETAKIMARLSARGVK